MADHSCIAGAPFGILFRNPFIPHPVKNESMNKKGSTHAKLTREGIAQAGFVETSPGVFGKPGSQAHSPSGNPRPSNAKHQRGAEKKPEGKAGAKGRGKTINPKGVRYQLVILSHRPRAIDPASGFFKFIEDALVGAGALPDDSIWFCDQPILLQKIVPEKEQKTEVYLFEINSK